MYSRITRLFLVFTLGLILGTATTTAQTENRISGSKRALDGIRLLAPEGNPSADLDQCANGAVGGIPVDCTGTAWQNGNLGHSQAHYLEGESVPYRLRFGSLTAGTTYTVTIEWDTTENSGGKHALDYLTAYNETETTANPCSGVPGCSLLVNDTSPIPLDAHVAAGNDGIPGNADDIVQTPGVFTLFDGQILNVSGYTVTGDYATGSQTSLTITFRATSTNPVLAWGGHISRRIDWGVVHSAIAITGSPYHMRLLDLNGAGGNQDRSLSSAATIFPGKITIIKDARPNTDQIFGFTATGPDVSNFSLVDDGTIDANIQIFADLTNFGTANAVTVTEAMPVGGYFLTQINCTEDASGGSGQQNTTVDIPLRTANIILEEGESVSCTYVNAVPTAATAIISGRVVDIYGLPVRDVMISATTAATGEVRYYRTNNFGFYQFTELNVGETYLITARSRRYTFDSSVKVLMLMSDLTDQDFTAIPLE